DFFQATIEFDGGAVVNLECNWILPPTYPNLVDSRFFALCERGVIDVDRMRSELEAVGPAGFERNTPTAGAALGQVGGFTFAAERHFVDCCLSGAAPLVGAADGVALTRVTCAIVESCRNDGAVIELR
ncbi:MAG: hypothetical protein HYU66_17320, partial [Armatimonadetes bacterium]|nr:hypothetical protein [Armatimonadota bacterium]